MHLLIELTLLYSGGFQAGLKNDSGSFGSGILNFFLSGVENLAAAEDPDYYWFIMGKQDGAAARKSSQEE